MTAFEINTLLKVGATDRARHYLKKLSLKERLPRLHELVPYVNETPANLRFFQDNFAKEIGALISAEYDYARAEKLYNSAKALK